MERQGLFFCGSFVSEGIDRKVLGNLGIIIPLICDRFEMIVVQSHL